MQRETPKPSTHWQEHMVSSSQTVVAGSDPCTPVLHIRAIDCVGTPCSPPSTIPARLSEVRGTVGFCNARALHLLTHKSQWSIIDVN